MTCSDPHPDRMIVCIHPDRPHMGEHYAIVGIEWIYWPNTEEPQRVPGLRRNLSDAKAISAVKGAVRVSDPETSRRAAESASFVAGTHRAMVMDIISSCPSPMSARQIGDRAFTMGMVESISSSESVRRRALELLEEGFLCVVGECESGALLASSIDSVPSEG